jgi:hypothetical protein
MYEQVMGAEFSTLGAAVQRFHRLAGRHELHGWVETVAPQSWPAKLLAWCLGTPTQAGQGPIRFELHAQPDHETWTRFFPMQTMRSRLQRRGGDIVESLGAARLTFALLAREQGLVMRLQQLHFLGIRCPAWLAPRIVAEESGEGGQLQFRVAASVPGIGVVASYRGHLILPTQEFA